MERLKAIITKALAGTEPTDEEIAEAVMAGLDIVDSIAVSLDRIATALERAAT